MKPVTYPEILLLIGNVIKDYSDEQTGKIMEAFQEVYACLKKHDQETAEGVLKIFIAISNEVQKE
jgi:hypothetical protein